MIVKNVMLVNCRGGQVMSFFLQKTPKHVYGAKLFLDQLQPFLADPFFVQPFFDQVSNKGFHSLTAGQFVTILQKFGLWGS
jgi:hypothetical protein